MVGLRCLGGGLRLPEGFLAAEPIPKTSSLVFGALDVAVGQGKNVFQPQNRAQVVPPTPPWPERLRAVSQLGPLWRCARWHGRAVPSAAGDAALHPKTSKNGSFSPRKAPKRRQSRAQ